MLCAEVGVEIRPSPDSDKSFRVGPWGSGICNNAYHPDVIASRKACALMNHKLGAVLMNCLTHRASKRKHECLLVPVLDVINNPSLTCGAP